MPSRCLCAKHLGVRAGYVQTNSRAKFAREFVQTFSLAILSGPWASALYLLLSIGSSFPLTKPRFICKLDGVRQVGRKLAGIEEGRGLRAQGEGKTAEEGLSPCRLSFARPLEPGKMSSGWPMASLLLPAESDRNAGLRRAKTPAQGLKKTSGFPRCNRKQRELAFTSQNVNPAKLFKQSMLAKPSWASAKKRGDQNSRYVPRCC
jgi:hypothetical protein